MKEIKKNPRKQLEKYSSIFMQLGLVLTMFTVYVVLEHEIPRDFAAISKPVEEISESVFIFDREIPIEKKIEKKVIKTKPKRITKIVKPLVVKNNVVKIKTVETIINEIKDVKTTTVSKKTEQPVTEATVSINNVQKTPVFKGCEGLTESESRACFEKKMQKHIQRYFNSDLAQDVGLNSGKYKILTQFVIDKSGNVSDVRIRAPHMKLKKETDRVVNKIPKFKPGMQNDKAVKVKYTLPITFKVE